MQLTKMERDTIDTTPLVRDGVCYQSGTANGLRLQLQEGDYTGPFYELDMTLDEAETLFRNGLSFIDRLRKQG